MSGPEVLSKLCNKIVLGDLKLAKKCKNMPYGPGHAQKNVLAILDRCCKIALAILDRCHEQLEMPKSELLQSSVLLIFLLILVLILLLVLMSVLV